MASPNDALWKAIQKKVGKPSVGGSNPIYKAPNGMSGVKPIPNAPIDNRPLSQKITPIPNAPIDNRPLSEQLTLESDSSDNN